LHGIGALSLAIGALSLAIGALSLAIGALSLAIGALSLGIGALLHGIGALSLGIGALSLGIGALSLGIGALSLGIRALSLGIRTLTLIRNETREVESQACKLLVHSVHWFESSAQRQNLGLHLLDRRAQATVLDTPIVKVKLKVSFVGFQFTDPCGRQTATFLQ